MLRLLKLFPNNKPPYQSVLEVRDLPLQAIVNHVLQHSYQVNCEVVVSPVSDQSLMLHQLPPLPGKEDYDYSLEALRRRRERIQSGIERLFTRALLDREPIAQALAELGFNWLAGREVSFRCSCSRQRMVQSIQLACHGAYDELFDPGQAAIEIVCEYCKTHYRVERAELERPTILPS
jgi:molecular chaperone Hsp33